MQSETILKGGIAFLAIALIAIIIVRQFAADETELPVESNEIAAVTPQEDEASEADAYCAAAQERYDKVMDMYMDRGSTDIMEQALIEAEENVDANCGV